MRSKSGLMNCLFFVRILLLSLGHPVTSCSFLAVWWSFAKFWNFFVFLPAMVGCPLALSFWRFVFNLYFAFLQFRFILSFFLNVVHVTFIGIVLCSCAIPILRTISCSFFEHSKQNYDAEDFFFQTLIRPLPFHQVLQISSPYLFFKKSDPFFLFVSRCWSN